MRKDRVKSLLMGMTFWERLAFLARCASAKLLMGNASNRKPLRYEYKYKRKDR